MNMKWMNQETLAQVSGEHPETKNVLEQVEKRKELETKKKNGHSSVLSWELSPRDENSRIWVEAPKRKRTSDKSDHLVPRQLRISPEVNSFLSENCNGSDNTVILALLMYAIEDIKSKNKLLEISHVSSQKTSQDTTENDENEQ